MKTTIAAASAAILMTMMSCKTENPLLSESKLPYGAPQFDKIKTEHYMPAFEQGIAEGKAEIDAIVNNPEAPTFGNTIEALEYAGHTLNSVASIFYNLKEADTNEELEAIAQEISPKMTEYSMYVSLNEKLFARVKAVWEKRDSLGLDEAQYRLLDDSYKGFVRSGANLSAEDKTTYSKLAEELSLTCLAFSRNSLNATNAYTLNLTDSADLAGLPEYALQMAAATAAEKGQSGWTFDLSYPSYSAFIKNSDRRDLRKKLFIAYGSRAAESNDSICKKIVDIRIKMANLLGYKTYADYVTEDRMVGGTANVQKFIGELLEPSLPAARKELATILAYAKAHGFEDDVLQGWDFSYWSNKYKTATYDLSDEQLKPYFQLDSCINAVFGLATTLYGIKFTPRPDIPGYHPDVKVYDVCDADGSHLALFYADFFPRASKRGGAWMTSFADVYVKDGVEHRPFISIVTNFSKPTPETPSLLTHDELTTFLHEFGHSLHGILAKGRYTSQTGTSVDHDFVELPSQIMENWAYEPEYLKPFAKHYKTGEVIPDELIAKIVETKNYNAAYAQVRQLQFGIADMAWHTLTAMPGESTREFEKKATKVTSLFPDVPETCFCTSFSHIFSGGYAAGYYSYKWAEVLEADAYSLFEEKGIFNPEVSGAFRHEILERGSSRDESESYRAFRGHDPQPRALLVKLGIIVK